MAGGWSKDGAVQDQIDASVADAVKQARSRLPAAPPNGKCATHCEECEKEIPIARREAVPGVRLCVDCQAEQDTKIQTESAINRRGSKDSQLR